MFTVLESTTLSLLQHKEGSVTNAFPEALLVLEGADTPASLEVADTVELFITELLKLLSARIKKVSHLWDVFHDGTFQLTERIRGHMEREGASCIYVNSTPPLLEENSVLHRYLFAQQLLSVTQGLFPSAHPDPNTKLRMTRTLVRLALNQSCLTPLLELLGRWGGPCIRPYYREEDTLFCQYGSARWKQFIAVVTPVGGTPLESLERGAPKHGYAVAASELQLGGFIRFDLSLFVPLLDDDWRDDTAILMTLHDHRHTDHAGRPGRRVVLVPMHGEASRHSLLLPHPRNTPDHPPYEFTHTRQCFYTLLKEYCGREDSCGAPPSALQAVRARLTSARQWLPPPSPIRVEPPCTDGTIPATASDTVASTFAAPLAQCTAQIECITSDVVELALKRHRAAAAGVA
ncbi:hypothetical protein AGDE_14379 [Angomonas deanei]|uniref:Uncharacterized protein n=1 Tax=Angomonas deanei TaxID=59799 RepID=A0A7G2CIZ5_9TRYP|nr:hypothetical protein AGDE_14379 [Angomonas deanei]CAD2219820.1 hypothetical protein, conserved [Angomonas deanei]|eukprot:EPY20949.1 hypothetical protein AGDE_14379 [Angomonas deanei]